MVKATLVAFCVMLASVAHGADLATGVGQLVAIPPVRLVGVQYIGAYVVHMRDDAQLAGEAIAFQIDAELSRFYRIAMPCGTEVEYPFNGLPEVDTPCPCGDPSHWLVKHGARP